MVPQEREHIHALSMLTLNPSQAEEAVRHVAGLTAEGRETFVSLADSNHVVLRALEPLQKAVNGPTSANSAQIWGTESRNSELVQWVDVVMEKEHARIDNAVRK